MCSIEGHHGRMAGYCLSNSKWISGSLRRYPFHYNAGLCYSPFQTSNCPVLLTFIDIPYFKWKHNTEVRRRFWDSRDPRWGQGRKLLQNFQMPNMLGWGRAEERGEENPEVRETLFTAPKLWMNNNDCHLTKHSRLGALLVLSPLSFFPPCTDIFQCLFIWMHDSIWPRSSAVLNRWIPSKVSDFWLGWKQRDATVFGEVLIVLVLVKDNLFEGRCVWNF